MYYEPAREKWNVLVLVCIIVAVCLVAVRVARSEDAKAAFAFAKAKISLGSKCCCCTGPLDCDCTDCECPNCELDQDYVKMSKKAAKENKGLVIWVRCNNPAVVRQNRDVYHVMVDQFPGVKEKGVVVGKPDGKGWMDREDFPATVNNQQLREFFYTPTVAAPAPRITGSTYPEWTWPGDLASHLQREHGVNTSGMSFEQMRMMHNSLHNSQSIIQSFQPPIVQSFQPMMQMSSPQMGMNCPT